MTEEKVRELFNSHEFKFAKTMPKIPHYYTLIDNWENKQDWFELVDYIKKNSVVEKFYSKDYLYYYLDGYKYWVMDEHTHETTLINRAKV